MRGDAYVVEPGLLKQAQEVADKQERMNPSGQRIHDLQHALNQLHKKYGKCVEWRKRVSKTLELVERQEAELARRLDKLAAGVQAVHREMEIEREKEQKKLDKMKKMKQWAARREHSLRIRNEL